MKKTLATMFIALAVLAGNTSCKNKTNDAELQTSATTIVSSNPEASVEIKDGTAHLSGTFEDEASRDATIAQLKAIPGIKDVHDMTTIREVVAVETVSPVDPAVQQKVADAIKDFPSVKVEVINNELTITGDVSTAQARRIKKSVDALQVGNVNYNYNVK